MANPADLVQEACDLLARYIPVLEDEVAEQSAEGPAPGMTARRAETPEPWNGPAGRALMDAWEGIPRLEAALRYALNGHPGARRGGSAGNITAAMAAIPKLAAGLAEDGEARAARYLERLINEARRLRAIDEAEQWRYIRGRPCRYCKCISLKVLLDAAGRPTGRVECHTWPSVRCTDGNGYRPVATMGTDDRGVPGLKWADGQWEPAPDLEGQAA